MKLESFDLDFPYIENEERILTIVKQRSCSRDDAVRLDYQNNWKMKRRELSLQTRCISAFYERLFGYIITTDCQKILIECVPEVLDESIKNFSGVYTVQVSFDCESFQNLTSIEKKKATLEILITGIRKVASTLSLKISPFEDAYTKIVKAEYTNEWGWRKSAKSPNKKYTASVLLNHDVDAIDISMIVTDNNMNQVYREKIVSELPDEYAYADHLGTIKWISNSEVALVNSEKNKEWHVVIKPMT